MAAGECDTDIGYGLGLGLAGHAAEDFVTSAGE
jgi:hypothetical protein